MLSNYDTYGLTTDTDKIQRYVLEHNNYLKLDIDGDVVYSKVSIAELEKVHEFKLDNQINNFIEELIIKEKRIFTKPNTKLTFSKIDSPTSLKYVEARKKDIPKLTKKLRYYDESYHKLTNK